MADLKDLVGELLSLNAENLAQRCIDNSDVEWCLSELMDILDSADVTSVVHCADCQYSDWDSKSDDALVCKKTNDGHWRSGKDFCSYGRRDISSGGIGKQTAQKWIFNGCATKCPRCGASFEIAQIDDGLELLYCPVCGKRVGGEAT